MILFLVVERRFPSPPGEDDRRSLSLDQQIEMITRKRAVADVEEREPSPPPKASKQDSEDTGFIDLLSRIPRDVKLTRAQFEELMNAHKAKQSPSSGLSSTSSRESKSAVFHSVATFIYM